jgi:urease accessory protein
MRAGYRWRFRVLPALLLVALLPASASAHAEGGGAGAGFLTGFLHPLGGIDHLLAMLAVGMWGAQLGNPSIWVLPVAFPMVMALGGVAGVAGIPLPGVEFAIALSVIALGSMIASNRRPPLWVAAILVGFFAVFHGHAHGTELPGQTGAVAYSAGFVMATGMIHLTGIGLGFVIKLPHGITVLRAGGAVIAVIGLVLVGRLLL